MIESLVFVAVLLAFEYVVVRFAKSTRDGEDWIVQEGGPHLPVNA